MRFLPAKKRRSVRCQSSGKVRYRSREDATRGLRGYRDMEQRDDHARSKWPVRVYECGSCKGWHLTSVPAKASTSGTVTVTDTDTDGERGDFR